MAEKTLGQEVAQEAAGKAVMWLPAITGAIVLGPVGVLLGLATSVAVMTSCCSEE